MIYTLTLNPALDKTYRTPEFGSGSVNKVTLLRQDPGGKGINVSKLLGKLGTDNCACCLLGGRAGAEVNAMIGSYGMNCISEPITGTTRTNIKISDDTGVTTEINEVGPGFDQTGFNGLKDKLFGSIKAGDLVVLSGSLPVGAPDSIYADLITELKSKGCKTILDCSGEPFFKALEAGPYFAKPNNEELGIDDSFESAISKARELVSSGLDKVIISLGGKGAVYCDGEVCYMAETSVITPVCTTGCGDSMVAGMCYSMENGFDSKAAFEFAMACSEAAALTDGTDAPDEASVKSFIGRIVIEQV